MISESEVCVGLSSVVEEKVVTKAMQPNVAAAYKRNVFARLLSLASFLMTARGKSTGERKRVTFFFFFSFLIHIACFAIVDTECSVSLSF